MSCSKNVGDYYRIIVIGDRRSYLSDRTNIRRVINDVTKIKLIANISDNITKVNMMKFMLEEDFWGLCVSSKMVLQ